MYQPQENQDTSYRHFPVLQGNPIPKKLPDSSTNLFSVRGVAKNLPPQVDGGDGLVNDHSVGMPRRDGRIVRNELRVQFLGPLEFSIGFFQKEVQKVSLA
jgi:hypothetical protein